MCWPYAGPLWGRWGAWAGAGDGAGELDGPAEKVLASGGGAGVCREKTTIQL